MVATLAFAGCVPGEAEYTMKTSEVRKALAGKPARVRVHLKTETVLSNAYDKVAFGGGQYTNRLDCVQRYVERGFFGKGSPFNLGEKTSDRLKVWIDEPKGKVPVLRMEADLQGTLGTMSAMKKALRQGKADDFLLLSIDSVVGTMDVYAAEKDDGGAPVLTRSVCCFNFIQGICEGFALAGIDGDDIFGDALWRTMGAVCLPIWVHDRRLVLIGDSEEPLYVSAKGITVNGKFEDDFKGGVRKGEKLVLDGIVEENVKSLHLTLTPGLKTAGEDAK